MKLKQFQNCFETISVSFRCADSYILCGIAHRKSTAVVATTPSFRRSGPQLTATEVHLDFALSLFRQHTVLLTTECRDRRTSREHRPVRTSVRPPPPDFLVLHGHFESTSISQSLNVT